MNFRTMQAANRRKTIGLLMGMGALMWCVVYAALSYLAELVLALFQSQLEFL
jgi:heat shock protein HtpX